MIKYNKEPNLSPKEFKALLIASTLGERRPISQPDRITGMLKNADIIITARKDGKLIGVSRSISDFHYCTYLSDLAVDQQFQKQGIGKELIRQTQLEAPKANLILLAAPAAVNYYPKIGMEQFENCFLLRG